ncbi:MAG: hypothetical protein WBM58_05495 [Sedimenticolaceae bacterium]
MGGLVQEVNLYRGHEARSAVSAGGRRLFFSAVGAMVAVLVLALAGELYLAGVRADRALVAENLRLHEVKLADFKQTLASPMPDPFLESELARLREARIRIDANLVAIGEQRGLESNGFSTFFGGLARNTLEGLWFRNVEIAAGGSELLLKGQTTEPALVPRLLQTLATEDAFAGRTFRKVTFERREHEGGTLVDFELRSAESEDVDDAG